jgi:hypothetical protein
MTNGEKPKNSGEEEPFAYRTCVNAIRYCMGWIWYVPINSSYRPQGSGRQNACTYNITHLLTVIPLFAFHFPCRILICV